MDIYIPMIFGDFQKQGVFQQNQFGLFLPTHKNSSFEVHLAMILVLSALATRKRTKLWVDPFMG